MESWKGRKRPWEDDNPIDLPLKRRGSASAAPVASAGRPSSPPPPRAGYYSRDSQMLNQRRLPPLYISSCNTSAESATSRTVQFSLQTQQATLLDNPRPRAQSLYNVFQHPDWQDSEGPTGKHLVFRLHMVRRRMQKRHVFDSLARATPAYLAARCSYFFFSQLVLWTETIIEHSVAYSRTEASTTITPPLGDQVHQPHLGTGPAPHAAGAAICCPSTCQGHECSTARVLMRHIATELTLLHKKVKAVTQTEHHAPKEVSCLSVVQRIR
jgi:hypothetical protein